MKSELGGNYEDVVLAMFKKPDEYDASQLRKAMKVRNCSRLDMKHPV